MGMFEKIKKVVQNKEVAVSERPILSLMEGARIYVVAENISLMGSSTPARESDAEIILIKAGDEIIVVGKWLPGQTYDVCIHVYNSENRVIAQDYYFNQEQLAGRNIKINNAATPRYG